MGRIIFLAFALILTASPRQTVEQQDHITNPTPCVWDADDEDAWRGNGPLASGASVEASSCIIADWKAHLVQIQMVASSPNLQVTIGLQGDGLSFTSGALPTPMQGKQWRYRTCLYGPDYDQSYPLPQLGDGHGIEWNGTLLVTNPTGKTVRDVGILFTVGAEQSQNDCKAELLNVVPRVWRGWVGG